MRALRSGRIAKGQICVAGREQLYRHCEEPPIALCAAASLIAAGNRCLLLSSQTRPLAPREHPSVGQPTIDRLAGCPSPNQQEGRCAGIQSPQPRLFHASLPDRISALVDILRHREPFVACQQAALGTADGSAGGSG